MKTHLASRLLLAFALSITACSERAPSDGVGSEARSFLASDTYTSLTIEIQAAQGYDLSAQAQSNLVSFLQARLNKPGGISIVVDPPLTTLNQTSYSIEDVRRIEAASRQQRSTATGLVAYFLVVDGSSTSDSGSSKILGQAYGGTSMVLYEKTIQALSGGLGQPSRAVLETTILEHEFGHLLGLVNTGSELQAQHHDSAHGAHCTVTNCLMYYSVDTSDVIANLLGGAVPSLDSQCVADLRANGGK